MDSQARATKGSGLSKAIRSAALILILAALLVSGIGPGMGTSSSLHVLPAVANQVAAQGRALDPVSARGTHRATGDSAPTDLSNIVITEILPDPLGPDYLEEWLEVHNPGPNPASLDGCRLWDGGAQSFTISSLTIAAGEYSVLGANGDTATNGGVQVDYVYGSFTFLLPEIGSWIFLECDLGAGYVVIDQVYYHYTTFPMVYGASFQLIDPALDNMVGANWFASLNPWPGSTGGLGTPGQPADGPLAVTLVSFAAEPSGGSINLTWETASEIDNLGFNLYRSVAPGGTYARLNKALIPSGAPGSPVGTTYKWLDENVEPGITYYYELEDVDVYGHATRHGPVSATAGPPLLYTIYMPFVANN